MMTEEDEDVLFDRAGLLGTKVKHEPQVPTSRKACRLLRTFFLCSAFFGLGLCIAIPGPTLLDLQARTNTSTEQISRIFFMRSMGYLGGSVLGGLLFDIINQNCLLTVALFITAAGTAAAPWSTNYLILMGSFSLQGISMGFLDTGGNVACLHIWQRNSGPAMQALHFSFGLGAFVAPLVAEPFLSHDINGTYVNGTFIEAATLRFSTLGHRHGRDTGLAVTKVYNQSASKKETLTTKGPRPVKPIANGDALSKDKATVDGTSLGKQIQNLPKPGVVVPRTPSTTTVLMNCTKDANGTEKCELITSSPTTTMTTTSTTTATTPTTTTAASTTASTTTTTKSVTTAKIPNIALSNTTSLSTTTTEPASTTQRPLSVLFSKVSDIFTNIQSLSKVEFAYLTIAAFIFLISVIYGFLCCCDGPCTLWATSITSAEEADSKYVIHKESRGFRVQILILLFVFYFLYVGMEVTYGGLIMTFTVKYLEWEKKKGTLVTSVFWGAFAFGRGLAIFLAHCLSPVVMLIADLLLTTLSLGGLVLVLETNEVMLWFCTATLGIGMASIFPTGITWAERYMQVTGKAAAVFVVGSALGEMSMPVLTGYLFDKKGPMCLMYIMLAAAILAFVIYIVMQNLASNKGERYQRLNTLMKLAQNGGEEEEIESTMDNFPYHNHVSHESDSSDNADHTVQNGVNRKRVTFKLPPKEHAKLKRIHKSHPRRLAKLD